MIGWIVFAAGATLTIGALFALVPPYLWDPPGANDRTDGTDG